MKLTGPIVPGYKVYEYLLLLQPPEELNQRLMEVKEGFADKYKTKTARWGKPYIALVHFFQYEMMEERILHRLQTIATSCKPIKIELVNFGSFPSHTIYVNVTAKLPIQDLVKKIRSEAQRLMKLNEEDKPHFMLEPNITIARQLKPWQYEQAWLEYSHSSFTGRFIAGEMVLQRRQLGEKAYKPVQRMVFQNTITNVQQSRLFI